MTKILKIEEFINESKSFNTVNDIISYLKTIYSNLWYKKPKDAVECFKDFVVYVGDYIKNQRTNNIHIVERGYGIYQRDSKYYGKNGMYQRDIKNDKITKLSFSRKTTSQYLFNESLRLLLNVVLNNNNNVLTTHNYEEVIPLEISFNFYKNYISDTQPFSFGWDIDGKIPPEYKQDFEKICKVFFDISGKKFDQEYVNNYIGNISLKDKTISGYDLLTKNFKANCLKLSLSSVVERIYKILKLKDENATIKKLKEYDEKEDDTKIETIVYSLTYLDKEHTLTCTYKSTPGAFGSKISKIKWDDLEDAFYACAEHYEFGCYIKGDYRISDKLKDIIE